MATIVLHVGMPKAGSSTIQRWLRDNDQMLASKGTHVLVYRHTEATPPAGEIVRRKRGPVNSGNFTFWYNIARREPWFLEELLGALGRLADELGTVVMTGEGIAQLFAEPDELFLHELNSLASRHTVRVAYYVRAQHESLEAAWRQWGFRHVWTPSHYMTVRQELLDYEATLRQTRALAPDVEFGMRLFHRAAFADRSIIKDFAETFLDMDVAPEGAAIWANPGLPLEMANTLRRAEPGRFFSSLHDNEKIARLKTIAADWHIPESPDVRRSRLVLQQYCYERFGAGNEKVARELNWPIEHLVPPVDEPGFSHAGLQELDTLWSTSMSEAEQELFFLALDRLLECDASGAPDEGSPSVHATSTHPNTGERRVTEPDHKATAKRAAIARSWMTELKTGSTDPDTPFLARRSDGSVFLIDGGRKRAVRSGLLAAALEDCLGPSRAVTAGELEAKPDGAPVEMFESPEGEAFVVFNGEYHPARGVPLTYPVSDGAIANLRRGKDIDLARANVPRRRLREVMALSYQWQRLKSAAKRKGVVGTTKELTKRASRALTKRTNR